MDTSAFFARKRQELQPVQPQRQNNLPWWQDPDRSGAKPQQEQIIPQDSDHDYSRADHLKSHTGNCPHCGSASYMKPSSSGAARCFDCGYISGRQVNDLDTMNIMAADSAQTLHVKQTADGGAQKYRTRIGKSGADIRMANAELEQSAQGKAYIDS